MMDQETRRKLSEIGKAIPHDLLKKGIRKSKEFAGERTFLEDKLRDRRTTNEQKREIRKALNSKRLAETWDRTTSSIDPKVGEEIGKIVQERVQKEIRAGRMKPPDPNDPFFKYVADHSNLKP